MTTSEDRMRVSYEWVIETVDEYDDIVDLYHYTRLTDIGDHEMRLALSSKRFTDSRFGAVFTRLGLIRDKGNQVEGLIERRYAYVEGGALDERFEEGGAVPKRFSEELAKRVARFRAA